MNPLWKRLTAAVLASVMCFSLLSVNIWAEETPSSGSDSSVTDQLEEELLPAEAAPVEKRPTALKRTKSSSSTTLTLYYDDRYSFADKYPNCTISIGSQSVTSKQVNKGAVTSKKDTAVLTMQKGSKNAVIATGTGTAKVKVKYGKKTVTVTVTVKAAPLTMLFLTGQSNMEGWCESASTYYPKQSIACEEGQVYSTYTPSVTWVSQCITGLGSVTGMKALADSQTASVVAGSLTGTTNQSGKTLIYALNSLTTAGKGKTGPDSGLAYEWNRLTGEKVWVINAAYGGTSVKNWVKGGKYYKRAELVFAAALKTANAEVKAGHYTLKHKLQFWLQGENDWKSDGVVTASEYIKDFTSMYQGFQKKFAIEEVGIISVRGNKGNKVTTGEAAMTSVRAAQYYMANSTQYSTVFMVSNANEHWLTDSGVKDYFKTLYSNGLLNYPVRSKVSVALPTKPSQLHPTIHYSQLGHNENGISAADGMFNVVYKKLTPTSARWRSYDGTPVNTLSVGVGESATAVLEITPLTAAKKVTYKLEGESDVISYDTASGTITGKKTGTVTLNAYYGTKKLANVKIIVE